MSGIILDSNPISPEEKQILVGDPSLEDLMNQLAMKVTEVSSDTSIELIKPHLEVIRCEIKESKISLKESFDATLTQHKSAVRSDLLNQKNGFEDDIVRLNNQVRDLQDGNNLLTDRVSLLEKAYEQLKKDSVEEIKELSKMMGNLDKLLEMIPVPPSNLPPSVDLFSQYTDEQKRQMVHEGSGDVMHVREFRPDEFIPKESSIHWPGESIPTESTIKVSQRKWLKGMWSWGWRKEG